MTVSQPGITIVGLGPGDPSLRTLGAQRALDAATHIVLRTRIHPGIDDLVHDPRVHDCDDLYQTAAGFDQLYPAIAARVVELGRSEGSVVFAAPGHPRVGERTVPLIEAGAGEAGIAVTVLDAVSFLDVAINAAAIDPLSGGLQIIDAEQIAAAVDAEPFAAGLLGINPTQHLLVGQMYNRELATAVKLGLSRLYPDPHEVLVVRAAGDAESGTNCRIPLHALDRQDVDHLTSLIVPPQQALHAVRSAEALPRIVARLREPDGCPWDREQTHATLRDAVLAEAYEVVDAIDAGDPAGLAEELGDLLLLVTMHAQLAEQEGTFRIEDVYEGINRKLIRRHPHVFAATVAETPDAVVATWEGVKAAERAASGVPAKSGHPFDRLPRAMPALRKAAALLAPRALLVEPGDSGAGRPLLDATKALLARGIDPERALDSALRAETAVGENRLVSTANGNDSGANVR